MDYENEILLDAEEFLDADPRFSEEYASLLICTLVTPKFTELFSNYHLSHFNDTDDFLANEGNENLLDELCEEAYSGLLAYARTNKRELADIIGAAAVSEYVRPLLDSVIITRETPMHEVVRLKVVMDCYSVIEHITYRDYSSKAFKVSYHEPIRDCA